MYLFLLLTITYLKGLEEVIGQEETLSNNGILKYSFCISLSNTLFRNFFSESNFLPSLILWGPPGTGKTTLARLLAQKANYHFIQLSAVDVFPIYLRILMTRLESLILRKQKKLLKTSGNTLIRKQFFS